MPEILIIDDDRSICRTLELHYQQSGYRVSTCGSINAGRRLFKAASPDVIILDLKLPDGDGVTLLREINNLPIAPPIIMLTGHQDLEYVIEAMKAGAFDYLLKPPDIDQLDMLVQRATEQNQREKAKESFGSFERGSVIVGTSPAIINLHKQIGLAARSRASVLITGESGSGKELVARAIHQFSCQDNPFIAVNCGASAPGLIDSELFGHKRGAFTGAVEDRTGRFEEAGDGTIFLDEIGDLPLELQIKLLRILQEKSFSKVGSGKLLTLRARVIVATNHDLQERVASGLFRKDLFFRISPLTIHVPALRDRIGDIPELAYYLIEKFGSDLGSKVKSIGMADMDRLRNYDWPGNVRELENVIQKALLHSPGDVLNLTAWKPSFASSTKEDSTLPSLAEVEKAHIKMVLERVNWRLGEACAVLEISRPTLRKKIAEYELKQ